MLTNDRFAHVTRQVGGDNAMLNNLTEALQCLLLLNSCYWTGWNYPILNDHTDSDVGNSVITMTEKAKIYTINVQILIPRTNSEPNSVLC